jgi:hypothetical protein
MTWQRKWHSVVVGGMLLAGGTLHASATAGQAAAAVHSSSPTYAIPLRDGSTAVVWWDAVSDPTRPGWRCEVPGQRGAGTGRTIIPLAAPAVDWQAALAEAKVLLKGRVAENE